MRKIEQIKEKVHPRTTPFTPLQPSRSDTALTRYLGAVRVMPSWSLSAITSIIERMGEKAQACAMGELTDLAARCEAEGNEIGEGPRDWGKNFSRRMILIQNQEDKFRALDNLSGLSPNTVDATELVRAAVRVATWFHPPRVFSQKQTPDTRFDDPAFLIARLESLSIDPPDNMTPAQIVARLQDAEWWKCTLRQNLRVRRENSARLLDARQIRWCSEDGLDERREHDERQREWAGNHNFSDGQGNHFCCPTPEVAARRQYAELQARNTAIMKTAAESELLDCCILTLNCPSRFHSITHHDDCKIKLRNPLWDGSSPADAIRWLRIRRARIRAALKRRGIGKHFILVTHVHEDATPHLHIVFFDSKENFPEIEKLARKYFDGGNEHQVDIKKVNSENGVAYACRAVQYISRAINNEGELEAAATKQISATYRFRRFATSQNGVTAYRMARRADVLPAGNQVGDAAKKGDFLTFYKAYRMREGKVYKTPRKNRYGESIMAAAGLELNGIIYEKTVTWSIVRNGEENRTVTANCQGGEAPEPSTPRLERSIPNFEPRFIPFKTENDPPGPLH
ncbi:replication endonuclease [Ferrovum myxofaciens]|uniref:Replication endonuclease n=1 Tax=Ferrovum myxofaciens TaxID=416213 RepID=A0A9E6MX25_9PROT|nr:replication endonuclease [Ferrovum myxofaciens]QKE37568.1 MAG: replication endonuclease [Ferrovum myxofaciens]QWY75222.1 MAG: replication endonuclease [Ferrovum myxofaciens]QWY77956.1 MAG: replication endonuclease [Ferrovum myxofaciens]